MEQRNREHTLQFVLGDAASLEKILMQKPYLPFADKTIAFLDYFYQTLREKNKTLQAADIAALAFWCRKGNLNHIRASYQEKWKDTVVTGKGVTFHIVPSNIPVLFAFSMAAALLAGNPVILRLPATETAQEQVIVSALQAVMERQPEWKKRIVFVRYGHEKELTDQLSQLCQVRVIWGGDHSIREIQQSVLEPGKTEIAFADRRSAAVFSAKYVRSAGDREMDDLAHGFYNDTYLNDQNACSSPSLLYWLGSAEEVQSARERFWNAASAYIQKNYRIDAHLAVQKWEQVLYLAPLYPEMKIQKYGNEIVLAQLPELTETIWQQTVPGGFFFESSGTDLTGLYPVLNRKCQTLTCAGMEKGALAVTLASVGVTGADRIVDIGHALDFSLVWDGMDLMEYLTRKIDIR